MDTMKDTTMQPATDVVIVPEATAEFISGLLARIEQLEADLATAEQDSRQKQARIDRLEGEESKQAALLDCLNEWKELAKSAEKERDELRAALRHEAYCVEAAKAEIESLRAKIEQMEKQEPVAWCATDETGTVVEALGMNQSRRFDTPLGFLPGAKGDKK